MDETVIRHHIPKEKEGTYYELPFEVPENVRTLTVEYGYPSEGWGVLKDLKPTNTVDLGLCDENDVFLGWSGSAHKRISVGEFQSSPGYLTEKINPGTWRILVGAYHIRDGGVDVTYRIRFTPPERHLYFGDLHMHSTASDGVFSPWELGARAKKEGLDFIAVADHNNYAENLRLPFVQGITFIPAVEWTHYKGHMNFFGVPAPLGDSFIANSEDGMRLVVAHARASGAVVSVNHPKCPFCPYLWEDDNAFDLMEVWNGPFTPRNAKAVGWWTSLLKQGRRIPIVGGSDFHKPGVVKLGHPVTAVFSDAPTAVALLKEIRAGHAFISESVRGPRLELRYGDALMGDEALYRPDVPVTVRTDAKSVVFVSDSRSVRVRVQNGEARFSAGDAKFVYAKTESARIPGRLLAITNPIYFKEDA